MRSPSRCRPIGCAVPDVIRQIGADDWRDWRRIKLQSFAESPEAYATSAGADVTQHDSEGHWRSRIGLAIGCWIAYSDTYQSTGVPIGMVALYPAEGDLIQLASMFVSRAARQQGIGTALIHRAVEAAAGRPLFLRVMDGNDHATRQYERAGFVHEGCAADAEGCVRMTYRPSS